MGILALDENGCVPMVTQYRYAFSRTLLEIPAGKREPGESRYHRPAGAEGGGGGYGGRMAAPGRDDCLPGLLRRGAAPVSGPGLTFGDTHPDEDEFLAVRRIPFDELVHQCLSGQIQDGKTVAAVLKAKLLLGL